MSLVLTGTLLLLTTGFPGPSAAAAPLSADDVVRYTIVNHPDPIGARSEIDIARADRREAFLGNPEVEASTAEVRVAQPLSPTGEGWHARREAGLRIQGTEHAARRLVLVVAAEARYAWIDASAADRRAELANEALELASRLRAAIEARAAQGDVADLDVRLARLEEAHALGVALEARQGAAAARVVLTAFHPAGLDAELGDPLDGAPEPSGAAISERSDVAAAELRADAARAALARERAGAVDPISVGVTVDLADGAARPWVAWSVPLIGRNQGEVARARGELAVARAEADRSERIVAADQLTADRVAASADADLGRLGDADADARAALAAIASGVSSGELDVSTAVLLRADVLDGWTAALDVRAATARVRVARLLSHDDPSLLGSAP